MHPCDASRRVVTDCPRIALTIDGDVAQINRDPGPGVAGPATTDQF